MAEGDYEAWNNRVARLLRFAESTPFSLWALGWFAYKNQPHHDPRLQVTLGGQVHLDNPVMAGAGLDKEGRNVRALHKLGFAADEVGAVLKDEQPGNPRPRHFRIGNGVDINMMGFNSPGMKAVRGNLMRYSQDHIPVGINIGENKYLSTATAAEAYAIVARYLYYQAAYFVVDVSTPNSAGVLQRQERSQLTDILQAINGTMDLKGLRKPLYVKISPDLKMGEIDEVIGVVKEEKATGMVAANSTKDITIKREYGNMWAKAEGGISGRHLLFQSMSTVAIAHIYRETKGSMQIIGSGGVYDAWEAWRKITAGASAVQVVTAFRSEGPDVAGRITRGLIDIMDNNGIHNISEAVGTAASKF